MEAAAQCEEQSSCVSGKVSRAQEEGQGVVERVVRDCTCTGGMSEEFVLAVWCRLQRPWAVGQHISA